MSNRAKLTVVVLRRGSEQLQANRRRPGPSTAAAVCCRPRPLAKSTHFGPTTPPQRAAGRSTRPRRTRLSPVPSPALPVAAWLSFEREPSPSGPADAVCHLAQTSSASRDMLCLSPGKGAGRSTSDRCDSPMRLHGIVAQDGVAGSGAACQDSPALTELPLLCPVPPGPLPM